MDDGPVFRRLQNWWCFSTEGVERDLEWYLSGPGRSGRSHFYAPQHQAVRVWNPITSPKATKELPRGEQVTRSFGAHMLRLLRYDTFTGEKHRTGAFEEATSQHAASTDQAQIQQQLDTLGCCPSRSPFGGVFIQSTPSWLMGHPFPAVPDFSSMMCPRMS